MMSIKSKLVEFLAQVVDEKTENIKLSKESNKGIAMIELALPISIIVAFPLCQLFGTVYTWITFCVFAVALGVSYIVGRIVPEKTFLRLGNWSLLIFLIFVVAVLVFVAVAYCFGIETYAERIETFWNGRWVRL